MRFLSLLLTASFQFCLAATPVEVVLTVPVETDLAVSGTRDSQVVWLEMIQAATSTLDLEQFYITDEAGEALEPVLAAIRDAAERGVKVRLIADSKFYKTYPDSVKQVGAYANAEARTIDFSKYGGGIQHAKYFIVDGKDTFIGSQNFDWRALAHIHELGLRVSHGSIAAELGRVFEKDWAESVTVSQGEVTRVHTPATAATMPSDDIQILASPVAANPKGIAFSGDEILRLMTNAQSTIRIQVMDYSTKTYSGKPPWLELQNAIIAAAKRGVLVKMLVNLDHAKKSKADFAALAKIANVEVRGVKIPEHSSGAIPYARLIHSKYLVADESASWVGTENWSEGYFMSSRNVGFLIQSTKTSETLIRVFEKLWKSRYCSPFGG